MKSVAVHWFGEFILRFECDKSAQQKKLGAKLRRNPASMVEFDREPPCYLLTVVIASSPLHYLLTPTARIQFRTASNSVWLSKQIGVRMEWVFLDVWGLSRKSEAAGVFLFACSPRFPGRWLNRAQSPRFTQKPSHY